MRTQIYMDLSHIDPQGRILNSEENNFSDSLAPN